MPRPRLTTLLDDGHRRPVTLVSAAPGAGKTTLLTSWLPSVSDRRAAWLTIYPGDDEQGRLPDLVIEALRRAGALTEPLDWPPSAVGEDLLDAAFDQLMDRQVDCVLVLDDVQELRTPATLGTLAHLVERAPAGLDIVLSTRADPPIGWVRISLTGRLAQIREADLSFSAAETTALLQAHDVELSPPDVRRLWDRTDGWAAGLRLAVGAFEAGADPHRFVTDPRAIQATVADYMLGEVAARLDPTVQDFLLRTSIAEHLTPELAGELSGDPCPGKLLAEVSQLGLFVVKVDDEDVYRYHSLFRALLQTQLRERYPGLAGELHRRAAAWHLANGLESEAEAHARAGDDWATVGRLILERWLEAASWDGELLGQDLLAGLPAERILRTPQLALIAGTEACRWSRREEAGLYRRALDETGPPTPSEQEGDSRPAWPTSRHLFDVLHGWSFGADDRSRAGVAALRNSTVTAAGMPYSREIAVLAQAEEDLGAGDLERARRELAALADENGTGRHQDLASAALAVVDATAGAVPAAEARLARLPVEPDETDRQPSTQIAQLAAVLCTAQQRGPRAAAGLLAGSDGLGTWWSHSLRCVDRVVRAAVSSQEPCFVILDEETARHPLAERALVTLGVLEVVDARGRLIAVGGEDEQLVLAARRQLQQGGLVRTVGGLADRLGHAAHRHPRTLVEGRLLVCIATLQEGERGLAGRMLREVLDLAAATAVTAPLVTHGEHVRPLLESSSGELAPRRTTALDLLDQLPHPGSPRLVEPLTEREAQVLQHLPTLMSNAHIARRMHLSVNTVKTHLKAVYRKLGVDGRRDAVLRGRELELL